MEFFIKQNTTLPLLKMQIVKDGRLDYSYICNLIEKSSIYFSMVSSTTGNPKIINSSAGFVNKVFIEPNSLPEYYIYYQFTELDTNKVGRYQAEFTLISEDGTLIVPISEPLYINITENMTTGDCDEDCIDPNFPCCGEN